MIQRLVRFFLSQRLLVLMLVAVILGGGWVALKHTPIDAFPDVSPVQVKLIFKAPGMTPAEVEDRVIAPLEMELLGIPNETLMRSLGKYGIADITLEFAEGTDIYWARQQISERLADIDLPAGVSGGMAPISTPLGDMFMFTIEGESLDLMEKRDLLDWVIRPALRAVPGVADINSLGGYARVYAVKPDMARMNAHAVSFEMLKQALENNNRNDGAGRLTQGEEVLLVRTQGNYTSVEDISNTVVRMDKETPVLVGDVAEVTIDHLTRYGGVTKDGREEAVEGLVIGLKGANARDVVNGVKEKLAALKNGLPGDTTINVFYDRSDLINKATWTVSKALIEAIVLVVLLLLAFLGNLRAAITVAAILPLAILLTFIMMRWYGLSANLMSLGGLVIALGMLVDAAVVVVENIVSHLEKNRVKLPRLHLIYRATAEVAMPVISGIGIIIIVFLPLLTLEGLEGKLFSPVAITIVFALAAAVLLSLTVIPSLTSLLLGKVSHKEPWLIGKIQSYYQPLLRKALEHPKAVLGAAGLGLLLAVLVFNLVGKSFMPQMDEGTIVLQIEKAPSISLEASMELDKRIQAKILQEVPEVKSLIARVGSDELGMDPMGINDTDTFLVLKPKSEWRMQNKAELQQAIEKVLTDYFPGINYAFTQPIQMRVDEMLTGVRGDLAVKVFGDDPEKLNESAKQVVEVLSTIDGADNVYTPINEGSRYLKLTVDRILAGRLGLDVELLEDLLRAQLEGLPVGTIYKDIRRIPLLIKGTGKVKESEMDFLNLEIPLAGGQSVSLRQLVKIEQVDGPVSVKREMGKRYSVVIAYISGRDLVSFVEEAKEKTAAMQLPTGYYLEWGGTFENQQRAAKRLSIVIPISLALTFLILFATFKSVAESLLIMLNVPLAMIGGIIALWLTGEYLSVPASVGFIALLGIAVLNGVVMVSYFNQLREQGLPVQQVVTEGAQRRLRPVLMTASIAMLGLIPLALASGPGSEIQRPLAIVVIGGLITATLLTLVVLPIVYRYITEFKLRQRRAKEQGRNA